MATLPDRIKELRAEARMTQEALAEKLQVSKGAVGNWETGLRRPDPETLDAIADFFNVDMDYLLGRTSERPEYSLEEQWLINCYRNADSDTREAIKVILRKFGKY